MRFYTLTSGKAEGADPGDWVVEGSRDGQGWTVLDSRRGERFTWRSQTRAFKLSRTGSYSAYRIRFARPAAVAEVELLDYRPVSASPVVMEVGAGAAAGPGRDRDRAGDRLELRRGAGGGRGEADRAGRVRGHASLGCRGLASSGRLANGRVRGRCARERRAGLLPLAGEGDDGRRRAVGSAGSLQVVGDTIEFEAGSEEERPWLFDADGSQLNNGGRYADNGTHFTYRFTLPAGVTGGTVTLDMGNQFLVSASTDGATWTEVLREGRRDPRPVQPAASTRWI